MTPDRPSIEELLDELQMKTTAWTRAVLNPYTKAEIEAARERVVAAREALRSRFLEQQKELLTPEEAQEVLAWMEPGLYPASLETAVVKLMSIADSPAQRAVERALATAPELPTESSGAAIQPGGTPRNE